MLVTTPAGPPCPATALVGPVRRIAIGRLQESPFSLQVYGRDDPDDDLLASIAREGILVPLVVVPAEADGLEVLSGHRRLACARKLGFPALPCQVRPPLDPDQRRRAILEYNRQRKKTFSQLMREADALETLLAPAARARSVANLRGPSDRRDSDDRGERTDEAIARALALGGKDRYRQARAVWAAAIEQDPRALAAVARLDRGAQTIHAAHKDLRRRGRFRTGFAFTPYDVWPFRHDRAYGVPHPGDIPAGIVAHLLHYYTRPGALVVDPMAGGGTTPDVCQAMGRSCLAYDLDPVRPDVRPWNVRNGFPPEAADADLIFLDPPYHSMLAGRYGPDSVAELPLSDWVSFLQKLARDGADSLRPGGYLALLVANQTEKDLPAGQGYIDHAVIGYRALEQAGLRPERRVSCPMSGGYLPQQVTAARRNGRMLGQVRDLLIMRKMD